MKTLTLGGVPLAVLGEGARLAGAINKLRALRSTAQWMDPLFAYDPLSELEVADNLD
jgi:hypothetical protein